LGAMGAVGGVRQGCCEALSEYRRGILCSTRKLKETPHSTGQGNTILSLAHSWSGKPALPPRLLLLTKAYAPHSTLHTALMSVSISSISSAGDMPAQRFQASPAQLEGLHTGLLTPARALPCRPSSDEPLHCSTTSPSTFQAPPLYPPPKRAPLAHHAQSSMRQPITHRSPPRRAHVLTPGRQACVRLQVRHVKGQVVALVLLMVRRSLQGLRPGPGMHTRDGAAATRSACHSAADAFAGPRAVTRVQGVSHAMAAQA